MSFISGAKGSTQTKKEIQLGTQSKFGSKDLECVEKWRTGHCPVHQARTLSNQPLSGFQQARSSIIHRTVRCGTGLSGEPAEQRLPARQ
jgi:hypothetical protein